MQIPGLSTQAYKYQYNQNRYKFNGIEYDSAIGLDYYEARFRNYDPQIGRFAQIDLKVESAESWSVYSAMLDNPVLHSDPLGDSTGLPANFYINRNTDGDQTGVIRNATSEEYSENPVKALFKDIIHTGAELTGLNSVDDASATLKNPNASTTDKVFAVLNVGLSTPGEGVKGGANEIKLKGAANPEVSVRLNAGKKAHANFFEKAAAKGWTVNPQVNRSGNW